MGISNSLFKHVTLNLNLPPYTLGLQRNSIPNTNPRWRNAQIRQVLRGAEGVSSRWLACHVRRTANLDADNLSHPHLLPTLEREAVEAGFTVHLVTSVSEDAWATLMEAAVYYSE